MTLAFDWAGPVVKAGPNLIPIERIKRVDLEHIEAQRVIVFTDDGEYEALGFDAIEIVMQLKPSALEGKRLKWRKGAWRFHNWFGHPLMDLLAMLGFKRAAIRWHDYTTPRPR